MKQLTNFLWSLAALLFAVGMIPTWLYWYSQYAKVKTVEERMSIHFKDASEKKLASKKPKYEKEGVNIYTMQYHKSIAKDCFFRDCFFETETRTVVEISNTTAENAMSQIKKIRNKVINNQDYNGYIDFPKIKIDTNYKDDIMEVLHYPQLLETAFLIKENVPQFNDKLLNQKIDYRHNIKQALNLGRFCTDLGYANFFGKKEECQKNLKQITKLSKELGFYHLPLVANDAVIDELMKNAQNIDALLQASMLNLEKIDEYLTQQDKKEITFLILIGGWIEYAYLVADAYEITKNEKLKEELGLLLTHLDFIRRIYYHKYYNSFSPTTKVLMQDLEDLRDVFVTG